MKINRRRFLAGSAAAGALTFLPSVRVEAAIRSDSYATLIDLVKCDGCAGKDQPLCVTSCRQGRQSEFPDPPKSQLQDYWPQKKHEDWSDKRLPIASPRTTGFLYSRLKLKEIQFPFPGAVCTATAHPVPNCVRLG